MAESCRESVEIPVGFYFVVKIPVGVILFHCSCRICVHLMLGLCWLGDMKSIHFVKICATYLKSFSSGTSGGRKLRGTG